LNATILSNEVLGGKDIKVYRDEITVDFKGGIHKEASSGGGKQNTVVHERVTGKSRYENPSNPALQDSFNLI
jgi:hypothetical protein